MTTAHATRPTPNQAAIPASPFRRGRYAVVVVTTALVNLIVMLVGSTAGASMTVNTPAATAIGAPLVIVASIVPLSLAGIATWLIARRVPAFRVLAARIVAVVAVLSAIAPFVMAVDFGTGLTLAVMHLVVGGAFQIAVLTGRGRA